MANNSTSEVGLRLGFAKLYAKNWMNGYETNIMTTRKLRIIKSNDQ